MRHMGDEGQGGGPRRLQVVDAPRFLWRGVLLDCGRHFFPLPFLKKFLDVMALHKLNRFHWHLCEDQARAKPPRARRHPRRTLGPGLQNTQAVSPVALGAGTRWLSDFARTGVASSRLTGVYIQFR